MWEECTPCVPQQFQELSYPIENMQAGSGAFMGLGMVCTSFTTTLDLWRTSKPLDSQQILNDFLLWELIFIKLLMRVHIAKAPCRCLYQEKAREHGLKEKDQEHVLCSGNTHECQHVLSVQIGPSPMMNPVSLSHFCPYHGVPMPAHERDSERCWTVAMDSSAPVPTLIILPFAALCMVCEQPCCNSMCSLGQFQLCCYFPLFPTFDFWKAHITETRMQLADMSLASEQLVSPIYETWLFSWLCLVAILSYECCDSQLTRAEIIIELGKCREGP